MIENEKQTRNSHVLSVARAMMAAARTAPKARGTDNLEILTVSGDDLKPLADEMRRYGEETGLRFFIRDAGNLEESEAVVLIGTRYKVLGLDCGFCGFATCADKAELPAIPCAFNTHDMGLAFGSAASVAADNRIDSRIMYSVGKAAMNIGMMKESDSALGITLSCTAKSPFFDRNFQK